MTAAYQKPLFWPHQIDLEFQRRQQYAGEWVLNGLEPDRLAGEWIHDAVVSARINRLWLSNERHRVTVEPTACPADGGEPICCYTAHHAFLGDDWLWYASPGPDSPMPAGEVFRRNLILSVLARSEEEAELKFAERLGQIRAVIERQSQRIATFESGLHEYLEAKLVEAAQFVY